MSIKIHHGPNGSYKTSGAIQDDAIPAIKAGRVIITNIRGFTLESVQRVFPDCPDTVEVINLSMESTEDLGKMREWFKWAPRGAFLIFDETQILFPKSWREKDLEVFDYPGGLEAAKKADRPTGWLDAWTRHRHWNWDIVLTTPNIRYIRDDIRLTCEKAYLHSNLAVIGISGRYKEAMHDAQDNRPSMDGSSIVEIKKIKDETFRLYQSTATGVVQDTTAGKNLFLSPKVLGLLVFIALVGFYLASSKVPGVLSGSPVSAPSAVGASSSGAHSGASPGVSPGVAGRAVAAGQGVAPADRLEHPFAAHALKVRGVVSSVDHQRLVVLIEVARDGRSFVQTGQELQRLGYTVQVKTACVVELRFRHWQSLVYCPGTLPPAPATSMGIASAAPAPPLPAPPVTAPPKGT